MLLIDGDVLVYRVGFSCDKDDLGLQDNLERLYEAIEELKKETNINTYKVFLSVSGTNFREDIFEQYKANRDSSHKPKYYSELRIKLVDSYGAELVHGQEADDAMGLAQTDDTVICTIDKDLMMIAGWHYNWMKPDEGLVYQTPREGFRLFCMQCLTGDSVDNIPGMYRIMKKKATAKVKQPLYDCKNRKAMWDYVKEVYKDHTDDLLLIAKLLWIRHTYRILDWQDKEFNDE